MSTKRIWKRHFVRGPSADRDELVDEQFLALKLTDEFGAYFDPDRLTFDSLVSLYWEGREQMGTMFKVETFVIADGAFVNRKKVPAWFEPHVRFVTVISPMVPSPSRDLMIFIVGPGAVKDPKGFLQVASWNGIAFNYYAVEDINGNPRRRGWTYQGSSFDAFSDGKSYDASYLGPFNGHVNGACIMKELHSPWYHWFSEGNFLDCLSEEEKKYFEGIEYLTGPGQTCFVGGSVGRPEKLESYVQEFVSKWFGTRLRLDFCETATAPRPQARNVHRWMAHLLLTTTVNICTSDNDGQTFTAPLDHFFNKELLTQPNDFDLLPDMSQYNFTFDKQTYDKLCAELRLSLLQEVRDPSALPKDWPHVMLKPGTLGGGKQTASDGLTVFLEVAANTEGKPFVALQPSYEDAQGVLSMQSLAQFGEAWPPGLLSTRVARALLMLDFWNPVYSWRRGVLMRYLPAETRLVQQQPTSDGGDNNNNNEKGDSSGEQQKPATYDLEAQFVAAIRASPFAAAAATEKSESADAEEQDSPERRFLALYDGPDDAAAHQTRVAAYLAAVNDALQTESGLRDYLRLAEARRRIYRPLPLDEFGAQLPYAVGLPVYWPLVEMTEAGATQPIPARGVEFLAGWTGSLRGYDPHLLPGAGGDPAAAARTVPRPGGPGAARCPAGRPRTADVGVTGSAENVKGWWASMVESVSK